MSKIQNPPKGTSENVDRRSDPKERISEFRKSWLYKLGGREGEMGLVASNSEPKSLEQRTVYPHFKTG
jgi:hypothetical protein